MATTSTCKGNARKRRFQRPKRNRYSETKRFSARIPTAAGAERPTKQNSFASCPLTGYFLPRRSDRDKSRLPSADLTGLFAEPQGLLLPSFRTSRSPFSSSGIATGVSEHFHRWYFQPLEQQASLQLHRPHDPLPGFYLFLVLAHHRRRILHFIVTAHPTAEWVVQQPREAFPFAKPPLRAARPRCDLRP